MSLVRGSTPVFQLRRLGSGQVAPIEALRQQFASLHGVHLPRFLDEPLLAELQRRLRDTTWDEQIHEDLDPPARNLKLADPALYAVMLALMNDPALAAFIERLTGCDPIGCWLGQLYWMDAAGQHRDAWHDDLDGNRMIGISINVSHAPFEGGQLSMRWAASQQLLWSFANTGPGDAIVFRLRDGLQHYISEVTGPEPKLAIAGWFQRTPRFQLPRG